MGLLPSFEDCTASDPVKEYYKQRSKESLEEKLELLTDVQALVGWSVGEASTYYPITEDVVGEDSVALIYNQDVIVG